MVVVLFGVTAQNSLLHSTVLSGTLLILHPGEETRKVTHALQAAPETENVTNFLRDPEVLQSRLLTEMLVKVFENLSVHLIVQSKLFVNTFMYASKSYPRMFSLDFFSFFLR